MTGVAGKAALVARARSLFERGLTPGSSGNLSLRLDDGYLVTPTGASLGSLDPEQLSVLDARGRHVDGDPPTKEVPLHLRMYHSRPEARAVVHVHSPYAVAVSVLADIDPADVLPPLTAYYVMRVGRLPLVPYEPPGDPALADALTARLGEAHCALLANHGPLAAAPSLDAAAEAIEEIEHTARLWLLLGDRRVSLLSPAAVAALRGPAPDPRSDHA